MLSNDVYVLSDNSFSWYDYRRGTARRDMLVNSYYVSRDMAVRKVSNNKNDLQGNSKALAMV